MISTLKTKLENYAPNGSLEDHPQAAVLIICYEAEGELFIVMTERSKNLPSHPGEVAYPGGKKETNDSSLIETALREASEEIDLDQNKIESYGLNLNEILNFVKGNNQIVSAGSIDTGDGRFVIKIPGLYENLNDVFETPIKISDKKTIKFKDIAKLKRKFKDPDLNKQS